MAVVKEAEILVVSTIENLDSAGLAEGEAEKTESRASGYLHVFDDGILITYVETQDGGTVTSEVKCTDGAVRVVRRGGIESDITFREGESHTSLYSVGPYKFDAVVRTRRIRMNLGEDGGRLDLFYNMKIGGAEKSSKLSLTVTVEP